MNDKAELMLEQSEIWRRQCARNLMDCYAVGMQALMETPGDKGLKDLTRLMVEGMTAVREAEDERAFYRMASAQCRACGEGNGTHRGMFRIYAAIFEALGVREEGHDERE